MLFLLVLAGLFAPGSSLRAQVTAANRVLELDGSDSYVQLPPDIFNQLTEATVEGWVKWDQFGTWSRFFDFGKQGQAMNLGNSDGEPSLCLEIRDSKGEWPVKMKVADSLKAGRWCHIAVVTGPRGVKLYLDGVLRDTSTYAGSFAAIGDGSRNFLGRNNWKESAPFVSELQGQIDEVRIWNYARTAEQIRESLFTSLTGAEPGLVGYWNFDDGSVNDLAPGHHHGQAVGNVKFTAATREYQVLTGRVLGTDQKPLADAEIRLWAGVQTVATSKTDADGNYYCLITEPVAGPCDLQAVKDQLSGWRLGLKLQSHGGVEANLLVSQAFNITGTVRTMDGAKPLEAAVVEAIATTPGTGADGTVISGLTDKEGRFKFLNFRPGEYRLRCRIATRYVAPIGAEVVTLSDNREPASVQFRVAPPPQGVWRYYTSFDGLAPSFVKDIRVDGEGAMWLATYDGLSRFDGQSIRTYTTRDGLKKNGVLGAFGFMMVDRAGRLVVGTQQRFNGLGWDTFPAERPPHPIDRLFLARNGTIWAAAGAGGGGACSYKDRVWTQHSMGPDGKANEVWRIAEDSRGTMWFGCAQGIARYIPAARGGATHATGEEGEWKYFDDPDGVGNPKNYGYDKPRPGQFMGLGEARGLIVDSKDNVWAGLSFHQGVSRFDGQSWRHFTTEDGLPESAEFDYLHEDRSGHIWAGGNGGLARFDGTRWTTVRTGEAQAIYDDGQGFLWVSVEEGLARLDLRHWEAINSQHGLPGNDVTALTRDAQGQLLIGLGEEGLARYDGRRFERLELPADAHSVRTVFADSRSNLWISGFYPRPYYGAVWSLEGGKWNEHRNALGNGIAYAFGEDASGRLWAGGQWNLNLLDGQSFQQIQDRRVDSMALDQHGRLWFAGLGWDGQAKGGVRRFDGEGEDGFLKWTQFGPTNGLPVDNAFSVLVDRKERVWVGTWNEGLARFDGINWQGWSTADGLGANKVNDIKEDTAGRIWVAHGKSVSIFDGTAWSVLDSRDGLSLKDVTKLLPEKDGSMWLAGAGGLLRYTRQDRTLAAPILHLAAENLDRSGTRLQPPPVTQGTRFTFDFGARDFLTEPAKVQFRYQWIEGLAAAGSVKAAAGWSKPTIQRRLEWSTNRAGVYLLAVQFIDRDLNYSEPALATLTIEPFWYRDARIMLPAGGGLMGLLGWSGFLTLRYGSKRREAQRLREQMLAEQLKAREALEAKAAQLQVAKETAETARQAAESANQAKSLFLANMSHEIRTPMNAILGYSQILRRDPELSRKHRQSIETIERSGDHLLGMINDILDLSKIEAGRLELQPSDFDLNEMIHGLTAMFRIRCQEKNLQLRVAAFNGQPVPVHGDEGKLRQVLINLLGNAVKFTDQGEITLTVQPVGNAKSEIRRPKSEIRSSRSEIRGPGAEGNPEIETRSLSYRFAVADSGPGISQAEQAQIFQPFHQLDEGVKRGGTGLGLAITRRQVELMGGEVILESTLGKGSRFSFELKLPAALSPLAATPAAETREVLRLAAGAHVDALVVDDVEQNRDVLCQLLLGIGCQVRQAASASEAFDRVNERRPDIIFMDIRMPVMNGADATHQLIAKHGPDTIKIVAITASVLEHERVGHMAAGFHDFLSKPFRFPDVCTCLKQLLDVELEYGQAPAPTSSVGPDLDPATCPLPPTVWDALKKAADRYSLTALKSALEPLEEGSPGQRQTAEYLKTLLQEGDMEGVNAFLERVKPKEH